MFEKHHVTNRLCVATLYETANPGRNTMPHPQSTPVQPAVSEDSPQIAAHDRHMRAHSLQDCKMHNSMHMRAPAEYMHTLLPNNRVTISFRADVVPPRCVARRAADNDEAPSTARR